MQAAECWDYISVSVCVCVCGLCGPRADLLASDVLYVIGW